MQGGAVGSRPADLAGLVHGVHGHLPAIAIDPCKRPATAQFKAQFKTQFKFLTCLSG